MPKTYCAFPFEHQYVHMSGSVRLCCATMENATDKKGNIGGMEAPHSTMTKFIRLGVDGDTSEKFLKSLTFADKAAIFGAMQSTMLGGEGKPSK